jgi:hypothetical protein
MPNKKNHPKVVFQNKSATQLVGSSLFGSISGGINRFLGCIAGNINSRSDGSGHDRSNSGSSSRSSSSSH